MKSRTPQHLQPATRRWFAAVVNGWELEEHHRRLLQLAGEAWDRKQQAREVLKAEGLTCRTRLGELRAHPAVAIERDAAVVFTRVLRELDLDIDPPAEGRRPPQLQRFRGGSSDAA